MIKKEFMELICLNEQAQVDQDQITTMIQFNMEFQLHLGTENPDKVKIAKGLKAILEGNSPGRAFLIRNSQQFVGMIYANLGAGMACGGRYLWINGIFIKPELRKKGLGVSAIKSLEEWAKSNGVVYIISSRDVENIASKKLFDRNNYKQNENINIDKYLD